MNVGVLTEIKILKNEFFNELKNSFKHLKNLDH